MIRVIAGRWRGRRLVAPAGLHTRPSTGRLREALFSSLGAHLHRARVIDLFAGSGALGIESLSRGAEHALFVEKDPRALRAIRTNLDALEVDPDRAGVVRADAWRWIDRLDAGTRAATLLLADPPYEQDAAGRLLPRAIGWVQSGALEVFALEHPAAATIDLEGSGVRSRTRRHGRGAFTVVEADPAHAGGEGS